MSEEYIDAEFQEDIDLANAAQEATKKGATFASVYGPRIYDGARTLLSIGASRLEFDSRERAAIWPRLMMGQVSYYAKEAEKHDLDGVPGRKTIDRESQKAEDFLRAYEAVSGMSLENPAREKDMTDSARAEAVRQCGSPKLSAHDRLDLARKVPAPLRAQAKELYDNGVCSYTESAIQIGAKYANAERDRRDKIQKPVRVRKMGGPVL